MERQHVRDAHLDRPPGSTPYKHLFQDAAGRLHAVFQRDNANPLQIVHAVSDDGLAWRSGTVVTQDIATGGGITDLRVATAPDHIGVTVWHGGVLPGGDVRAAPVGPDAPLAGVVSFSTAPKSVSVSNTGRFTYKFIAPPLRSGTISLKSIAKIMIGPKKQVMKLAAKTFRSPATRKVTVTFTLSKTNLRALKKRRMIAFRVTATLSGKTFTTKLTLRAPRKR